MKHSMAYDLPVRIFHWSFAILFVFSFTVANVIDDEAATYAYHKLSGILMVILVFLRVIWGFVGSQTSRFNSFRLRPKELKEYFESVFKGVTKRTLGHNPASSYAAVAMMMLTLGIGFSGLMMTLKIYKHFFKEVHELLANGFLVVVVLHVLGVILHQYRHRDGMILSMLNGKKESISGETEIKSNYNGVALIFAVLIVGLASNLYQNYDLKSGKLAIFGTKVQLGEHEHDHHHD